MGKTLYLIGEASENEEGGMRNTYLGDQTGYELRARKWYEHNPIWGKVYRFNNETVAEEIASRMEKAILNGFVGYDASHRSTFLTELQNVDMDATAVNENCATDCAALAYTAILGATGVTYDWQNHQYEVVCAPDSNNKYSPVGRAYDSYIERQCVNAGFDITVFTLDTTVDSSTEGAIEIDFQDGTTKYYVEPFYNTPYDYYDSGADSTSVRDNLHIIYLNQENEYGYDETFLSTELTYQLSNGVRESAWKRGDIIRTLMVWDGTKYQGHIAVWL